MLYIWKSVHLIDLLTLWDTYLNFLIKFLKVRNASVGSWDFTNLILVAVKIAAEVQDSNRLRIINDDWFWAHHNDIFGNFDSNLR